MNRQTYRIKIRERMTGNSETLDSSVGLVPTNALVSIKCSSSRIVAYTEVNMEATVEKRGSGRSVVMSAKRTSGPE